MSKLLLEDEEYGVKHVKELGDVEDVGHHQRPFGLRVFGVVNRLTGPAVVSGDIEPPSLAEPPEAEEGLEEVVGQDDPLQLERLPVFHEPFCARLEQASLKPTYLGPSTFTK